MRIDLAEAVRLLSKGDVIAVPTDTVYGLAASLSHLEGIQKVFSIKKRPPSNPLIIQIADQAQISPFVSFFPVNFIQLANTFWPGALTLVVPILEEKIPQIVRANLPTAGFRVPGHDLMRALLRETGPLVVPSANFSGRPSATSAEQVEQEFGSHFPVLDGGRCAKGIESTLLCFEDPEWIITRLGAISADQLKDVLGYAPKIMRVLDKPLK